jgi:nitrate/nitrite transport system ATP-binding protein
VSIPRPRSRETVIEHPHYYKIRNHIIHFLVRHAKHGVGEGTMPGTNGNPVVVNFEEDSLVTH